MTLIAFKSHTLRRHPAFSLPNKRVIYMTKVRGIQRGVGLVVTLRMSILNYSYEMCDDISITRLRRSSPRRPFTFETSLTRLITRTLACLLACRLPINQMLTNPTQLQPFITSLLLRHFSLFQLIIIQNLPLLFPTSLTHSPTHLFANLSSVKTSSWLRGKENIDLKWI